MANKHYTVNTKIILNIPIEVNIESLSNYFSLTDNEINNILANIAEELPEYFLSKLQNITHINDDRFIVDSFNCTIDE
jgi:uncharacterized phage-associated protein